MAISAIQPRSNRGARPSHTPFPGCHYRKDIAAPSQQAVVE